MCAYCLENYCVHIGTHRYAQFEHRYASFGHNESNVFNCHGYIGPFMQLSVCGFLFQIFFNNPLDVLSSTHQKPFDYRELT